MTLHCQSPLRSYLAPPSLLPSHTLFQSSEIWYLCLSLPSNCVSNQHIKSTRLSSVLISYGSFVVFMLFRSPFLLKPLSQYLKTPDSPFASQITSHFHLLFGFPHQPFKYCIFLFLFAKDLFFSYSLFPQIISLPIFGRRLLNQYTFFCPYLGV